MLITTSILMGVFFLMWMKERKARRFWEAKATSLAQGWMNSEVEQRKAMEHATVMLLSGKDRDSSDGLPPVGPIQEEPEA
jgi:hypothetical protein